MKMMKLAVLPVAIAGVLASNAAFSGSEACFEVYKQADAATPRVSAGETLYSSATCVADAVRTGASATNLQKTIPTKIAYELTQNKDLNLADVNANHDDLQIVYIPTTDIPGGTLITMKLTGATFKGNAGQIHLMKTIRQPGPDGEVGTPGIDGIYGTADDSATAADDTYSYATVASSDGTVDGASEITFLTKAGITIGAGTRLALTKSNSVVEPVSINIANKECAKDESAAQVTIAATGATTDGGKGYDILGGVSGTQKVVDMSTQFVTFIGVTPTVGEVNAESTNSKGSAIVARTEFVYDAKATHPTLKQQQYQIVTPVNFIDRSTDLDQKVTLGLNDRLVQKFWAEKAVPTTNVKAGIYSTVDGDNVLSDLVDVDNTLPNSFGDIAANSNSAYAYKTLASEVFTAGDTKTLYYVVENTDHDAIMNYNYRVNVDGVLDFDNAGYLDHCSKTTLTHDIKVNGAVLKVPYTFDSNNTWVRITNESSEAAEITMDIFDESGHEAKVVPVGSVGKKSSVVLLATDLVAKAKAAGMITDGKSRYTMTFTVTAPMNTVHGVSVQKIPGGVDRVVPVLDENNWKM